MTRSIGSLFSGGGGWEAGARMLGMVPLFGVEKVRRVAQNYVRAFGAHVYVGGVEDAPWSSMPRVDVLASSPPCPAFSNSGLAARSTRKKMGLTLSDEGTLCDPRSGVYTLDATRAIRPEYVFIENAVHYERTEVFMEIASGLIDQGYHLDFGTVDFENYGLPSARKRMICRCRLGRKPPRLPMPSARPSWYDAIRDLIPSCEPVPLAPWQQRGLADNPPPKGVPILVAGGNVTRNERGRIVWRAPSQASWTTQKSPNTSGMRVVDEHGLSRQLSTRAIARLCGFPDDYPLPDGRAESISLLGNAMPPVVAMNLLRGLP